MFFLSKRSRVLHIIILFYAISLYIAIHIQYCSTLSMIIFYHIGNCPFLPAAKYAILRQCVHITDFYAEQEDTIHALLQRSGRNGMRKEGPGSRSQRRFLKRANGVQARQITDISGFTHGVGWCAPQQGACKLSLNVKEWRHSGSAGGNHWLLRHDPLRRHGRGNPAR